MNTTAVEARNLGDARWIAASQKAFDLYQSNAQLWRKEDLLDIEDQLQNLSTTEVFRIRRMDGSYAMVKNPMCGVENPVW